MSHNILCTRHKLGPYRTLRDAAAAQSFWSALVGGKKPRRLTRLVRHIKTQSEWHCTYFHSRAHTQEHLSHTMYKRKRRQNGTRRLSSSSIHTALMWKGVRLEHLGSASTLVACAGQVRNFGGSTLCCFSSPPSLHHCRVYACSMWCF